MNEIQQHLIDHVRNNGLDGFLLNPKNSWLIVSGGYEEELTAFLYHSVGGANFNNLYYETPQTTNQGQRIIGDINNPVSERPDMIITGNVGVTDNRLVVAKIRTGRVIKYSNIPIIGYIQLGHDFANMTNCHINKFNVEYSKLQNTLNIANANAEGLLHIQIATEYINISNNFERYRNNRGHINNNNNWLQIIQEDFDDIDSVTYELHRDCGLHVNIHIFFKYGQFDN